MTTSTMPQRLPVPDDFPAVLDGGDEHLLWEQDRMHFPKQLTPYEAEKVGLGAARGMHRAMKRYELPVQTFKARAIHGYVYNATVPVLAPPAEMAELDARAEAALLPVIACIGEIWEQEMLPEVLEHLEAMQDIDLPAAELDALISKLGDAEARLARLWEIHMEAVLPAYLAMSEFDELYRDLLETDDPLAAYALLQGFPNKTTEIGRELWRLSRRAVASHVVAGILETEAAGDVVERLGESDEGRAFLVELDDFLERYGHRGPIWGIAAPSFIEDPTPVIKNLKDYAGQPDESDPVRELARLAAARDAAIADARARIEGYPAQVVGQFDAMLASAQAGLVISEDHGFFIDFWAHDAVRQLLMEAGRRFVAAGAIAEPGDVLMLTSDEIRTTAARLGDLDRRALVAARRAALDAFAGVTPPPALGTLPPGEMPDTPATRFLAKFWGAPVEPAAEAGLVRGSAGSAGTATGTARVARSLAEASRLAPGDVLVAETTAPPWTPLFASIAAVVTDTGGVLSHSAVVAREYGIPAVVGTGNGTIAIRDGDVVEVDGLAGLVRVVG